MYGVLVHTHAPCILFAGSKAGSLEGGKEKKVGVEKKRKRSEGESMDEDAPPTKTAKGTHSNVCVHA